MSPQVAWPIAALDPIARARVLVASMPGAALAERTIDAPFAEAWAWIEDLPHSVPSFDRDVSAIRIRTRVDHGDGVADLTAAVRTHGLIPYPFTIRLEPGFCLMQARARAYVVVMAAAPVPDDPTRTRMVHAEGVPLPGARLLRPVIARLVDGDVDRIAQIARDGFRT